MTKIRQPQVWCWWDRDEPEDGMTGFFTAEDRNRFFAGPFNAPQGCADLFGEFAVAEI